MDASFRVAPANLRLCFLLRETGGNQGLRVLLESWVKR